jgi:glycosyltransferase involved in cell wall biosynthesis
MSSSTVIPSQSDASALRVAFVAGSLTQGGAEKQLVYMARALRERGVNLRVFALTRGEFYEDALRTAGIEPIWVGKRGHPSARLAVLGTWFARYRPHIVQSTHFFSNLYAAILGRSFNALAIGSIRNDAYFDMQANGRWGPWLMNLPPVLLANSWAAKQNAETLGVPDGRTHVISNVIDLVEFDRVAREVSGVDTQPPRPGGPVAMAVCRVVSAKRLDRFVQALARARRRVPELTGVIVGDGLERAGLEQLARSLDLDGALTFVGRSSAIPAVLRRADMLVLSSDHEGFPNVVLEAMSAGLPVIATPAGDVRRIVEHGETGYVVPFDEADVMAAQIVHLARSPELRKRMGTAGRTRVEQFYSYQTLSSRLIGTYRSMAEAVRHRRTRRALPPEARVTTQLPGYVAGVASTTR